MTESRAAEHFRRIYANSDDPWSFHSPYEQQKYRRSLDALGARRFASAVEIGCSIGVLTRMLAERCDALLGLDIVEEPLALARTRCADQPWVRFERMQVPNDWPAGRFDLIVLSEVLYFLSAADIDRVAAQAVGALTTGGTVLLVNWLGESDDPTPGQDAAERFIAASGLPVVRRERTDKYRLDVLAS